MELRQLIADAEPFALTGIVVTEVLQGLRREVAEVERYLSMWELLEPRGYSTYLEAAAIFRSARRKGLATTTIDCLIAAIALEHGATLFTLDRDFARIAGFTDLRLYKLP
jgi:predicted nucleic acid-binding protein